MKIFLHPLGFVCSVFLCALTTAAQDYGTATTSPPANVISYTGESIKPNPPNNPSVNVPTAVPQAPTQTPVPAQGANQVFTGIPRSIREYPTIVQFSNLEGGFTIPDSPDYTSNYNAVVRAINNRKPISFLANSKTRGIIKVDSSAAGATLYSEDSKDVLPEQNEDAATQGKVPNGKPAPPPAVLGRGN